MQYVLVKTFYSWGYVITPYVYFPPLPSYVHFSSSLNSILQKSIHFQNSKPTLLLISLLQGLGTNNMPLSRLSKKKGPHGRQPSTRSQLRIVSCMTHIWWLQLVGPLISFSVAQINSRQVLYMQSQYTLILHSIVSSKELQVVPGTSTNHVANSAHLIIWDYIFISKSSPPLLRVKIPPKEKGYNVCAV